MEALVGGAADSAEKMDQLSLGCRTRKLQNSRLSGGLLPREWQSNVRFGEDGSPILLPVVRAVTSILLHFSTWTLWPPFSESQLPCLNTTSKA